MVVMCEVKSKEKTTKNKPIKKAVVNIEKKWIVMNPI
jgi:hypothetical protein